MSLKCRFEGSPRLDHFGLGALNHKEIHIDSMEKRQRDKFVAKAHSAHS